LFRRPWRHHKQKRRAVPLAALPFFDTHAVLAQPGERLLVKPAEGARGLQFLASRLL